MRFVSLAAALLLAACANKSDFKLPGVYRIDIQQGNIIEQAMLAKLKPGMDKSQVQFIMGTPSLVDPFHTNQWEYIYTFSKRGGPRKQRHITLHFEDDKLAYLDGDVGPRTGKALGRGAEQTLKHRRCDAAAGEKAGPLRQDDQGLALRGRGRGGPQGQA